MIYIVQDNNPDAIEAVKKITQAKDGEVIYLTPAEMDAFNDINFVKVLEGPNGIRKPRKKREENAG